MTHLASCVAATFALAVAAPSAHACDFGFQTVFSMYEDSAIVVHARVIAAPQPDHEGTIELEPIAVFKQQVNHGQSTVKVQEHLGSTCAAGYRLGAVGIAFVSADGRTVGAYEGFMPVTDELLAALTAWSTAADAGDRTAVLVDLIDRGGALATDAIYTLLDDPVAIEAVTATQRATLVDALPRARRAAPIALILARLGVPDLARLLPRGTARRKIAIAVGKQHRFEAITDPDALADVIAKQRTAHSAVGMAAFERCERLRRTRLFRFSDLAFGVRRSFWSSLAQACRDGVAVQ